MRTVKVTAPGGVRWSVRVVWEPRWRVLARRFGGWRAKRRQDVGPGDVLSGGADVSANVSGGGSSLGDELAILAIVFFALVAVAVLFWWVLLPLALIIVDGLILLALLIASVVARVLFRRPWIVRATAVGLDRPMTSGEMGGSGWPVGHGGTSGSGRGAGRGPGDGAGRVVEVEVVGWRAALRRRDAMAASLRSEPAIR